MSIYFYPSISIDLEGVKCNLIVDVAKKDGLIFYMKDTN